MSTLLAAPQAEVEEPGPAEHSAETGPAAVSGILTVALGLAGVLLGGAGLFGSGRTLRVGWLLPLAGARFDLDPLGGFFVALTGAVSIAVGCYTVGYARAGHLGRVPLAVLPLFVAAMLLVPMCGSVPTFLLCWELMAAASLVLVLTEHRRAATRDAGLSYAVMTQLGFAAILLGLVVLAASAGDDSLAGLASRAGQLPAGTRSAVFLLTLVGFGSKAGLLPLHAWLPRAHPEAPSPVSALMSAAMVNLGVYGIIRVDLGLLGRAPTWWGLTLLAAGGLSAVFGALQAAVATDLKRLLAYSTTENMGLVTVALGAAMLLRTTGAAGAAAAATIALTAALLHLVGHAAFKTLGFLSAGAVLAATGLRDLDRLGGLARRMPATTVLFGIAALGASGLPLGAGFVSEWLLLQTLVHAPQPGNTTLALAMPLVVGAVALTTGLGIAAMVKALGVGFLARARSTAAEHAREAPASMLLGMALAAAACAVLAVAPVTLAPALREVLGSLPGGFGSVRLGWQLRLPGIAGSIAPAVLAGGFAVAVLLALAVTRYGARHRPAEVAAAPLWACGADTLSTRMQYTATSFAEPLQRVFDDVLRPDTDVEVSHSAESQYFVDRIAYRARLVDAVETRLYRPVLAALAVWAGWVRRAHTGSVHLYLAYGLAGVLVVLVVSR
jgi:hydrogenase-4 component B